MKHSALVTTCKRNLSASAGLFLPSPDKGSVLPFFVAKMRILTGVGLSLGIRILLVIEIKPLGTLSSFSNVP